MERKDDLFEEFRSEKISIFNKVSGNQPIYGKQKYKRFCDQKVRSAQSQGNNVKIKKKRVQDSGGS